MDDYSSLFRIEQIESSVDGKTEKIYASTNDVDKVRELLWSNTAFIFHSKAFVVTYIDNHGNVELSPLRDLLWSYNIFYLTKK